MDQDSLSLIYQDIRKANDMDMEAGKRKRERARLLALFCVAFVLFPISLMNYLPGKSVLVVVAVVCAVRMRNKSGEISRLSQEANELREAVPGRVRKVMKLEHVVWKTVRVQQAE